uniref:Uncharacterized protein n=1 Tax=Moschus moschiferus TaxID=68415 RepID=A0A8C6FN47_MOSMO
PEQEGILRLEEAEFYNMASGLRLLSRRGYQQGKQRFPGPAKHVSRGLQRLEEAPGQMVATVSTGGKFQQLISIGPSYNCGNEDQAEFLCVVSRELNNSTNGIAIQPSEKAKVLQDSGSPM